MAEGTKIIVCVVDGLHMDLAKTGIPLSIFLLLQQQGLLMDTAQWSAKQTATGFLCPSFGPSSVHSMGPTGCRRKQKRRGLKRKSGSYLQLLSPVMLLLTTLSVALPSGRLEVQLTRNSCACTEVDSFLYRLSIMVTVISKCW